VRGPLRWVQNRGAQNRGEAPSPSLTSFARPLPARRGEVKIPIRSRDACAPELCPTIRKIVPRSRIASHLNRRWDRPSARSCYSVLFEHDLFGKPVSTFPDHARQTKGKRNAGRRISPNLRAIRARLARSVARSPVGVPPRRLLQRTNAAAQLQNALPGTWSERTIPMVRKIVRFSTGVTRSFLSQSSDKVADRSSCRPGVFPKPPGSGGDEPPPAGTALAPSAGVAG